MKKGKISDIFLSFQGEGPYAGAKQLFIRFYGCNLGCKFCDTKLTDYKVYSPISLMSKVLKFKKGYEHLAITGGEPLLQSEFLRDFLKGLKARCKKPVYLETNGVLHGRLPEVMDFIDIVSMDFKLPSSTGKRPFWKEHERFVKKCGSKKIFIKAVITDRTSVSDIQKMGGIISRLNPSTTTVLQPVTPAGRVKGPGGKKLLKLQKESVKILKDVRVIPQLHKKLGIK